MRKIIFLMLTALLAACSTTTHNQYAAVHPTVTTPVNDIGKEKVVGFKIIDQRGSSIFAKSETHGNVNLNSDRGLLYSMSEDLDKMISSYGFTPATYDVANPRNMQLILLSNEVSTKKVKDHYVHSAGASVMVKVNDNGRHYQKVYSGSVAYNSKKGQAVSDAAMTHNITQAYNQALAKIESDNKLWNFLA